MKKLVLLLSALSIASISYAGSGCGGCSGEKEKTDAPAPTEEGTSAQKA